MVGGDRTNKKWLPRPLIGGGVQMEAAKAQPKKVGLRSVGTVLVPVD